MYTNPEIYEAVQIKAVWIFQSDQVQLHHGSSDQVQLHHGSYHETIGLQT